jgi:hypothetical protein
VSARKLVSIAERKQFRICKMQKRKNAKLQKHKITKTQKCKKGAKSIFLIDKENAYILQRKIEEGKSVHRGFALWVCSKPLISGLITYF